MALSTFDRKIRFDVKNSIRRFYRIMSDKTKAKPITFSPYTQEERDKAEQLLRQALQRSEKNEH